MPEPGKKRLSLAERIKQAHAQKMSEEDLKKERDLLDSVLHPEPLPPTPEHEEADMLPSGGGHVSNMLPSGGGHVSNMLPSGGGQVAGSRYQVAGNMSASGGGQVTGNMSPEKSGQVAGNMSASKSGQVAGSTSIPMPQRQALVYNWFFTRDKVGEFNKYWIVNDTQVPYGTVRKAVDTLVTKGYLEVGKHNPKTRCIPYKRLSDLPAKVANKQGQVAGNMSASGGGQVAGNMLPEKSGQVTGNMLPEKGGQVTGNMSAPDESSYNTRTKERFNKSFVLMISDYWRDQGVTVGKFQEWAEEFGILEQDLITQMHYAEHTEEVQSAKKPRNYFYTCLQRGGLPRPPGYELPLEKLARVTREAREAEEKARAELLAAEEEKAFEETLQDPDQVEALIGEMEKTFMTLKKKQAIQKFRDTGEMSEILRVALRREFAR